LLNVKLLVHNVTSRLQKVKLKSPLQQIASFVVLTNLIFCMI